MVLLKGGRAKWDRSILPSAHISARRWKSSAQAFLSFFFFLIHIPLEEKPLLSLTGKSFSVSCQCTKKRKERRYIWTPKSTEHVFVRCHHQHICTVERNILSFATWVVEFFYLVMFHFSSVLMMMMKTCCSNSSHVCNPPCGIVSISGRRLFPVSTESVCVCLSVCLP